MKKVKDMFGKITYLVHKAAEEHMGAYAAQSAFFFMICMIPIMLLLMTLVQYTPVTKEAVTEAVVHVFPSTVSPLVTVMVNQVYSQSTGIISATALVALWSAGKGVLAVSSGLNCVYRCRETRNYFLLRVRASLYTVMFLMVILLLLVLAVFGNSLHLFIIEHEPFLSGVSAQVMDMRMIVAPVALVLFLLLIYKFLPNRKDKWRKQIPGAAFAAAGWMAVSWIFSVYVDIFRGFRSMYGSLTTIVLIMLWMYFCMYCILLGAKLNVLLYDKLF